MSLAFNDITAWAPGPLKRQSMSKVPFCVSAFVDRHHGTPMLLEGVRCIGVELEYDSEQSDWQGFD